VRRIRGDFSAAIAAVKSLINDLDRDLAAMPAFKVGTPFHLDRLRSREGLASRLEWLTGQQRTIAESN
jgi:hypothetical protein